MNFKSIIFTVSIWVFGHWFTDVQAQQVAFTLEESVNYALENNAEARSANLEIQAAKGLVGERTAEGLPQITTRVNATKNLVVPITPFPAQFSDPEAPEGTFIGIQFSPVYSANLTATVSQMIFNGSYFIGLKAAKTYKQLVEFDKAFTELQVIENVKKAYFSVLVSKERETLIQANLNRLDTLLKETEILYQEGFAEKIDVTRIQVQNNNIRTELNKAKTSTRVSKAILKLQMGFPEDRDISLSNELDDFTQYLDTQRLLSE
jgi:outer membrane protein TolC